MRTKKKPQRLPRGYKQLVLQVDPCRSALSLVAAAVIEGYEFVSMERTGTRAVVTYRKL